MDPSFEAQLQEGDVDFTERDASLLEAIHEQGSLNKAATALGRSYSRCQKRIDSLEDAFGTLVERTRGGPGGGGSRVTEAGRELLARFERLQTGFAAAAGVTETVFSGTVTDRSGEIAEVETAAGPIRALVPPGSEQVQVGVRADAVTLHAPEEAPAADGTSARNRFDGVVESVRDGENVGQVAIDVGAETPLSVLVTATSRERLGLEPGCQVVATFKATAARCTDRKRRADE
ncbi:TOBE domain-containing protein [Halanaeroarchaeum sulfurireducens]|uniref:Molybdenum-binding protein n=1 Tax=Halanaeroarchaeum sulfurireducens TaxID=1604004 RepID=A0A0F7P8H6_9EURY|nr:TOBE domain-containing protein [Halanaeroarchaeum sulfurireducens]AKH97466.1 molybdenum-binding protein [Halanaeroarchaeum sulfurireducens]ALG81862.1 molybdenum-binding protein [Halanaeroarchaeum sulfurireducens]